jgi:hypothetical protein
MTFFSAELNVTAGAALMLKGTVGDPVAAAYKFHVG